jgi:hypothetical protein
MPALRDVRRKRETPAHILRALGRTDSAPLYIEEEKTPVRLILAVREELKEDIEPLKALPAAVAELTGQVSTTNELLPQMMSVVKRALDTKLSIDEHVIKTQTDITSHRAITNIDNEAAEQAARRESEAAVKATKLKVWLKVAGLFTSGALVTTVITLLATRC